MPASKTTVTRVVLGVVSLIFIVVSFQNCGKKESTVESLNGGGPSTDTTGTTTTLAGGGGTVSSLTVYEDFENWFTGGACTNPSDMASCLNIMGPNNGRPLIIRKFAATCTQNRVSAWLGGQTLYHGSANGNPGGNTNIAPVRFNIDGATDNEPLVTRSKQTKVNGTASVEFLAEGATNSLVTLMTHATPEEIPGCAATYGIPTYKSTEMVAYYIGYFPAGVVDAKAGFGIYIANTKGGGTGLVAGSFIEHTLTNSWYRIEFSRNGDFALAIKKYGVGTWSTVGSKTIPAAAMKIDGVDMPLGYVGINSDVRGNVSFDNFNINW